MRLVDAVDAMADNRGELLFELRGATQRQFALYRVLRGQAERTLRHRRRRHRHRIRRVRIWSAIYGAARALKTPYAARCLGRKL